jgi:protein involved in polysaccharide export with SLBB domain
MTSLSRALVPVSLAAIVGLAFGCASDGGGARRRLPPVVSPAQSPVRYSEIRPEDHIPRVYRVRPGDVVGITIADLVAPGVETVKAVRVSEVGTISLPLLGPIHVAGLTEEQMNERIQAVMKHYCI